MPTPFIVKRILFSLVVGLVLGAVIGEIPFMFLRETARPPQEILLTIPKGAADQVARGEQPPSIPESMIFVVGDTLVVQNQDVVDHKLGLYGSLPVHLPACHWIVRKALPSNAHSNLITIWASMCILR